MDTNKPLSMGAKLGYSVGSFGENLAYNFYYLFFIYFLTDFAGMNSALAGTVSLIAVIWDAVTDPLIGHMSDNSKNPKGRRRPWVLRFSAPLGIMIILLFVNVPLTDSPQFIYFVVVNILFWMTFTAVDIPYMVLGSEITRDHKERLSLRWMCSSFNYISYAVAGYTLSLTFLLQGKIGSYDYAWVITAALMALLVVGSFIIAYRATKGKEEIPKQEEREAIEKTKLFKSIIESLRIKPYRNMLLYTLFSFTGIMLYTSAQVYLFEIIIGASEFMISNIYLIYAIMVILLSPLMGKIGIKLGNKRTLLFSILFSAVGFTIFKFIPINLFTVWGILLACAVGVSGFFVNAYAVVYDIAEVASVKTKSKNEGVLVSFFSFMIKFGTALGMWLLGIILAIYNYDPVELTQRSIDGIIASSTFIPGIICAISALFIYNYKLTEKDIVTLREMKKTSNIDDEIVNKIL